MDADVQIISNDLKVGYEGTLDKKKTKYRVTALASDEGVLRFGDDSDYLVEDGLAFPPIPPLLSASRLPVKISDYNVSI